MTDPTYQTLALERPAEHLLVVRINRPDVRNAISTQVGADMLDVFARLVANPGETRCVVLTGAGDKAFCAGGDLKERKGMTDEAWTRQHVIFERSIRALMACPTPIIAAVNGAAYAGGCELALTADFIYAAEHARFALTEVTLGIMPGAGATQNLARAVGERRAKEIILTGKPFSAQDALDWGIVNKLCAPEKLMEEALLTAQTICDNAPISVRQAKRSMHFGTHMDVRSALFFEVDAYNKMVGTEDRHEGVRAFNEKRKPKFKGK